MKVLYAIQGTGNGHISRAREIIKRLNFFCDFDLLISGDQHETDPGHMVKYRLNGLTMCYNSKGSISFLKSMQKNSFRKFMSEVYSVPVDEYDLVINDFEPVTAWACKMRNIPCVSVSHQASLLFRKTPKARLFHPSQLILKYYAPAKRKYGFHFRSYSDNIYPPLIRSEIRELEPVNLGHILVYLPAFSEAVLLRFFRKFHQYRFEIYSKGVSEFKEMGNCVFRPIGDPSFNKRLARSGGVICSAGFELPSESLFLGKKLLVIPIQNQYEQACNAVALKEMGVAVVNQLKETQIMQWLRHGENIPFYYHDQLDNILHSIFEEHIIYDQRGAFERVLNYDDNGVIQEA